MLEPVPLPAHLAKPHPKGTKALLDRKTGRLFIRGPHRRYTPICLICGVLIINFSARQKYCNEHAKQAYHEWDRKYHQRSDIKAKMREYMYEYNRRPDVKAKMREYYQRPEVKAKRREYMREYNLRRKKEALA